MNHATVPNAVKYTAYKFNNSPQARFRYMNHATVPNAVKYTA